MSSCNFIAGTVVAGLIAANVAGAQVRAANLPPGQLPPPGMCRVWVDGVAPGRQPRVTDCNTARANRPANSRVIYGSDSRGKVATDYDSRSTTYDARLDPRNRAYDHAYAERYRRDHDKKHRKQKNRDGKHDRR